jgi:hypothetical protein
MHIICITGLTNCFPDPHTDKLLISTRQIQSMSNSKDKLTDELANLLNETAETHHNAFAATNGEDPEWPIWYADYLLDRMRGMLNSKFTKSELIYILVSADKENRRMGPGAYWPRFSANFIVGRYT